MPIDPRIPLGVTPVQVPSPLDILQQVSQLQEQRAQAAARQTAAQEAQAKRARQAQVDAAYEKAVKVDPQTGKVTVDRSVLLGGLPGSLVPSVMKELDADEQSVVNLQTATLNLHKAKQGHLASAAQTVLAAQGDPTIWGVELRGAHEMQLLDDEAYERLRAIDDPAQIQAIAQSFVTRAGGEAAKPPDLAEIQTVENDVPVTKFVPKVAGASYPAAPKTAGPRALQAKDVLLDGKPALATFDPDTGTYHVDGQDVTARVRPIPPQGPGPEPIVAIIGADGKPVYVSRSQALGQTPTGGAAGTDKLSAGAQEDIATMLTIQDLGKVVLERGEANKWSGVGPFAGRVGSLGAQFNRGSPEAEELRDLIGNIQGTITKLRGGTALSPQEKALLDSYTPTPNDSVLKIKAKLRSLDVFITAKRENMIRVASGQYTPRDTTTTEAKKTDPMGIR